MFSSPILRNSLPYMRRLSTQCLPPPTQTLRLMSPATKKTTDYIGAYFTYSAIGGAIGGALVGNWSGEMENIHPDRKHLYSEREKKINRIVYTGGGTFFGIFSGPMILPGALLFSAYILAREAKIID